MRKMSSTLITTLAGAAALLAAACGSSTGKTTGTGTGGSSGGGGTGGTIGIPLTPSATGFVQEPTSGIIGPWYAYGDGAGPDGLFPDSVCGLAGFTSDECTTIASPTPGGIFPPDGTSGAMCTNGVAAKVLPKPGTTTPLDYSDMFGGGIGLDFNNMGANDAGVTMKLPKDLSGYGGLSFDFYGSDIPPGNVMRVNFPFDGQHGTDSPYWAANSTDTHSTIVSGTTFATEGHNVVTWAKIFGPAYLATQNPPVPAPAFDPSKVISIQFQVFTSGTAATAYNFCVNNLTLLPKTQ